MFDTNKKYEKMDNLIFQLLIKAENLEISQLFILTFFRSYGTIILPSKSGTFAKEITY